MFSRMMCGNVDIDECATNSGVCDTHASVTLTPVAATLQQDPSLAPVIQVTLEMELLVTVCQLLKLTCVQRWVLCY